MPQSTSGNEVNRSGYKYDQSLSSGDGYQHCYNVSLLYVCCFVFELWVSNLKKEEKKMNKTSPIHL